MTVLFKCDRCDATDDLHYREVEVTFVGPHPATPLDGDETLHLCGYCASLLRRLIMGGDVTQPKETS